MAQELIDLIIDIASDDVRPTLIDLRRDFRMDKITLTDFIKSAKDALSPSTVGGCECACSISADEIGEPGILVIRDPDASSIVKIGGGREAKKHVFDVNFILRDRLLMYVNAEKVPEKYILEYLGISLSDLERRLRMPLCDHLAIIVKELVEPLLALQGNTIGAFCDTIAGHMKAMKLKKMSNLPKNIDILTLEQYLYDVHKVYTTAIDEYMKPRMTKLVAKLDKEITTKEAFDAALGRVTDTLMFSKTNKPPFLVLFNRLMTYIRPPADINDKYTIPEQLLKTLQLRQKVHLLADIENKLAIFVEDQVRNKIPLLNLLQKIATKEPLQRSLDVYEAVVAFGVLMELSETRINVADARLARKHMPDIKLYDGKKLYIGGVANDLNVISEAIITC